MYFFYSVCFKPHANSTVINENIKEIHILVVGGDPGISNFKSRASPPYALVNYIKYMSQTCLPLTRAALKCFVSSTVKRSRRPPKFDIEKGPSNKWIQCFLQRQDELTLKVPEMQEKGRTRMANQTVMDQHFKLLNEVTKLGLENAPTQIFNCDETGFSGKDKSRTKVIGIKGIHNYQQQVLTNSNITAQMCVSADGRVLPTFIIFEKSLPHKNFKDGVPGNWLFGSSDNGYMDGELFKSWFEEIFIPFCGSRRPVSLILDNHDSHVSIGIIEKAKDNQIGLYGLPPHTTHIVQPLDIAIYGPLKGKVKDLGSSIGLFDSSALIGKAKFPLF